MRDQPLVDEPLHRARAIEVFFVFLKLGLTSFGGPVAHIAYFRREFVLRRLWLDESAFGDLVSLCQFLPGPASSQLGMAVGWQRAGIMGSLAAWLGFTLPSALLMVLFALSFSVLGLSSESAWIHGLKIAAVAVVGQAVWGMGKNLAPDRVRATLAAGVAVVLLWFHGTVVQMLVIAVGAVAGLLFLTPVQGLAPLRPRRTSFRWGGRFPLASFFALLVGLPLAAAYTSSYPLDLVAEFYRAGALVFGGGHVVLPLLQTSVVFPGWVTESQFLAGYGAAQAVPGPLFTFAGYLGALSSQNPSGWIGGGLALIAIFLPAFLLIAGVLPFWETLKAEAWAQKAVMGINASVVGILLAAFYDPVWTSAVRSPADFALVVVCFMGLVLWELPPILVVAFAAVAASLGWG